MMTTPGANGAQSKAIVKGPAARFAKFRDLFERARPQIAQVVPKHMSPEKLLKVTLSAMSRTPALMDCTPESILLCLMQSASLGLEMNGPLGLAYMVPYKTTAQFIPGYRGLVRLAIQSGEVLSIQARAIRERDEYHVEYGLDPVLTHIPYLADDGGGDLVGVYSVAKMKDGEKLFEFMAKAEVDAIRARSMASGSGPWVTDYNEMAKKTVLRRHCKGLPLSEEKLGKALELQARAESGEGPDMSEAVDVFGEIVETVDEPQTRTEKLESALGQKAGT